MTGLNFGERIETAGQNLFERFHVERIVLRDKIVLPPDFDEHFCINRTGVVADQQGSCGGIGLNLCDPPDGHQEVLDLFPVVRVVFDLLDPEADIPGKEAEDMEGE